MELLEFINNGCQVFTNFNHAIQHKDFCLLRPKQSKANKVIYHVFKNGKIQPYFFELTKHNNTLKKIQNGTSH